MDHLTLADIAVVAQRENHRRVSKNGDLVAAFAGNGYLPG